MSDATEHLRYVYVQRTRCPACLSVDLQTLRSQAGEDGTVSRRTRCRTCEHKFFVIVETDRQSLADSEDVFSMLDEVAHRNATNQGKLTMLRGPDEIDDVDTDPQEF